MRLNVEVKWMIILLSTYWISSGAVNEIYSSTDQMTQLIDIQREFAENLNDYREALQSHIDTVKSLVNVLENNLADTWKDAESFISSPLAAYQLVRKLNKVWTSTRELLEEQNVKERLQKVRSTAQMLPGPDDVKGVVMSLLRLQDMYRLHPRNISAFSGIKSNIRLDADETFDIALVSYQHERHQSAFLWMQETLRKLTAGEKSSISEDHLALFSSLLSSTHDAIHVRDLPACSTDIKESMRTCDWTPAYSKAMENTYEDLCTGRRITTRDRKLVCRYRSRNQVIYGPFKEEEEWHQPLILRYHDFLSEREMDTIKRLARPKLSRAKVVDPATGKKFSAEFRVSKSAWLSEDEEPLIGRVNRRIADVTGLDMKTAEELQVANYGIGGQYEPHYDSKLTNDSDFRLRGGRIATILIYMSDVDIGGATVFPNIGAALQPERGSAVLWFNLLENGNEDDRTLHAACPVFVGNKWVANKWIRARGQEMRRKCSTVQSE